MTDTKVTIADNPAASQYELTIGDELAGHAEYRLGADTIIFTHTVVDEKWNGRGLGTRLAGYVLDDARKRGLRVRPKCPFIRSYIENHPEYADLVQPRT